MTRLTLAILLGLLAAVAVAWRFGGAVGAGVLGGYLLGAGLALLGVLYQRHVLVHRPERGLQAGVLAFLFKLFAVLVFALVLRFVEPVAVRLDWRGFLVAFAGAAFLILPLGTMDAVRVLKEKRAHG